MTMSSNRRRTSVLALAAVLLVAACGAEESTGGPVVDPDDDGASETLPSDTTTPATEPVATSADETAVTDASTPTQSGDKPEVEVPDEIPTELQVTTLIDGEGPEAAPGDTVQVHYVGVLSDDGTEFDNSYDRGQSFPVTIGETSVITGWTEGLVGAQEGSQIQLDIPGDLAYGEAGRAPTIGPDAALTFVIDVMSVTPAG